MEKNPKRFWRNVKKLKGDLTKKKKEKKDKKNPNRALKN